MLSYNNKERSYCCIKLNKKLILTEHRQVFSMMRINKETCVNYSNYTLSPLSVILNNLRHKECMLGV